MGKLRFFVVVAVMFTAAVAGAQRPQPPRSPSDGGRSQGPQPPRQPFKWWQDEKVKPEIGMTAEQSARIEEIFQADMPKLASGKNVLDRLEKRLSALINADGAAEADVSKQVDRVEDARAALAKERTMMFYRMHRVLMPEQRTKLTALREKWDRERQGAHRR